MKKYLLLLTLVNGVLGSFSWSSDDLSDDPWAFGKPMTAEESLKRHADQENVEPCAAGQAIKSTGIMRRPLTKSKTSLNLLADAQLALPSLAGSFANLAATPSVLAPQFERYSKYYYNLDFVHRGATGEIIKLGINRNLPCKRTGLVYPATCRLEFNDRGFTERTPAVFGQQSFEGPHDLYEVPIDGKFFNKFVVQIPTLVENFSAKTKDKPSAQLVFYKPDGQFTVVPLELESLTFDKP
jgi:hypothetical protein